MVENAHIAIKLPRMWKVRACEYRLSLLLYQPGVVHLSVIAVRNPTIGKPWAGERLDPTHKLVCKKPKIKMNARS